MTDATTTPPDLPADHPTSRFGRIFADLHALAGLTPDALRPRLEEDADVHARLAEVNALLLGLAGLGKYDPAAGHDLQADAAAGAEHLVAALRALADTLAPLPDRLARQRRALIPQGAVDDAVPVIRSESDFREFHVLTCPARPDAFAAVWSSLRPGHPAKAFVHEADLPHVPHVGPVLVLTETRTGPQPPYFELAPAIALSRTWRDALEHHRLVEGERAEFGAAREKEREAATTTGERERIAGLEREVVELRRRVLT